MIGNIIPPARAVLLGVAGAKISQHQQVNKPNQAFSFQII